MSVEDYDALCDEPLRWVCGACGKTSRSRSGQHGGKSVADRWWDESCMLRSVICRPPTEIERRRSPSIRWYQASDVDHLTQVTIYDHPKDFPLAWVVREWWIYPGIEPRCSPDAHTFRTVDEARDFVAELWPELVLIQRPGEDPDPCIHEVYT